MSNGATVSVMRMGRPSVLVSDFNPARLVHGASDHGKIEPLGGADIAEENLAGMERDPALEGLPAGNGRQMRWGRGVEFVYRRETLLRGGERG